MAMLKIFRRVVGGPHPEAEMGRYLTEHGFTGTPALLGEMVRIGADGTRHTLAVAQCFVRNQGDGWNWTLEWLVRALSDLDTQGELGSSQGEHVADYASIAGQFGRRLGEMHTLLAQPSDDPAFAPERADEATARRWTEQVTRQIEAALAALGAQPLEGPPAEEAARLNALRQPLLDAIAHLARAGIGTPLTRVHGDLHLGQTLVTGGDITIIDFEGEPARTLDERRAKASPMKDVAGVWRSFDYAAAVMQRKSRESHAHLPDDRRDALLAAFIESAGAAFLDAYRAAIPSAQQASDELLDLFLIEKAAYEVAYEAANRPTWIDVPLHGLTRLADRVTRPAQQAAADD